MNTHPRHYKVAFLITSMNRGGTEARLVDVLKHLDCAWFEPILFVGKDGGDLLEEVHDQRVYIGVSSGNILRSLPALWRMMARERPHAVWCLQSNALSFFGRLFARINGARAVVISLHGMRREGEPVMDWPNRLLTPWTTNRVVVLSQQYRAWAIAQGIPERLLTVQYNGVDTRRFHPAQNRRNLLGIDPSRPIIGAVGRLHPKKAHEVLIHAAKQVVAQFPDALFIIAGEGPRRAELQQLIEQSGLHDHVRLLGQRSDIPDVLRSLDVFIITSDDGEGCSNAVLEALATGLPVVSTDFGGAPELVDNEVGVIVPRRDHVSLAHALMALLRDPARRATLGQAARSRAVEHFSLETMIKARETLLLQLLE